MAASGKTEAQETVFVSTTHDGLYALTPAKESGEKAAGMALALKERTWKLPHSSLNELEFSHVTRPPDNGS